DDLRLGRTSVLADDEAARADGRLAADRLERHAGHARQHAVRNETVPGADTVAEPREARAPTAAALRRGALDGERSRHPGGAPSPASADAAGPVSASPASEAAARSARTRVPTRPATSARPAAPT